MSRRASPRADAGPQDEVEAVRRAVLEEVDVGLAAPVTVDRLTGGYSWRTYLVTDATGRRAVARVAPDGGTMEPYDPDTERRALAGAPAEVPAPRVLAVRHGSPALGRAFAVHSWLPGRVVRLGTVAGADDRSAYRRTFGRTLGRLHAAGDPAPLDPAPTVRDAVAAELDRVAAQQVAATGGRHPAFTIGMRWLVTHLPDVEEPPVLCHGDFRMHNLLWDGPGRLSGVLDWERAWAGDPMIDVAFGRRFSGWCAVDDDAVPAYVEASGRAVAEHRVAYGLRFERVRSYTSSWRGFAALLHGRSSDLALFAIGEAGEVGAWGLASWLVDGPLRSLDVDAPVAPPPLPAGRLEELAARARREGDDRLAAHLDRLPAADRQARDAALAALRATVVEGRVGRELAVALRGSDPERAWSAAYEVLSTAAASCGPDVVPAVVALGTRFTARPTLRTVVLADD